MIVYLHRGTGMARVGLECSIDLPNSISYYCCCGCGCGVDNAAEDGLNKQLRDGGDGGVKKSSRFSNWNNKLTARSRMVLIASLSTSV
jgi:hypothetical protein